MVGMLARMDEILINFGLVVVVGCVGGKILGGIWPRIHGVVFCRVTA